MSKVGNQFITSSAAMAVGIMLVITEALSADCVEKGGYDFPNAGLEAVLNSDPSDDDASGLSEQEVELNITEKFNLEQRRMMDELVMANVDHTLNVRADASEDSEKVGFLYRDCGGTILEQKDGWTKIKSGALTGWCSDEFLLFGDDAVDAAEDVGRWIVKLKSEAVRVRMEPSEEAETIAFLAKGDYADFIEIIDNDWISIEYEGDLAYLNAEYIDIMLHIDEGETIEAVQTRKKIEEQLKAEAEAEEAKKAEEEGKKKGKTTTKYETQTGEAVAADADELRLLGALIYCEAGNQPYDGMVAVGAVVMNRVKSPAYPNTIYSVIYASGQFTPALSGKVAAVYNSNVPDSCLMAAAQAINGVTTVGGATHFRRNNGKHDGIVIGAHVFW